MRVNDVASVEITFKDGAVRHYKENGGDIITMNIYPTTTPPYLTLIIAPVDFSQKDVI